jgi:hypothetical protein
MLEVLICSLHSVVTLFLIEEKSMDLITKLANYYTVFMSTLRERSKTKDHSYPFQKFKIELLQHVVLESKLSKNNAIK